MVNDCIFFNLTWKIISVSKHCSLATDIRESRQVLDLVVDIHNNSNVKLRFHRGNAGNVNEAASLPLNKNILHATFNEAACGMATSALHEAYAARSVACCLLQKQFS